MKGKGKHQIYTPPKIKEFDPDKHWVRKCLSCQKEVTLDRRMYICNPCKRSEPFQSGING